MSDNSLLIRSESMKTENKEIPHNDEIHIRLNLRFSSSYGCLYVSTEQYSQNYGEKVQFSNVQTAKKGRCHDPQN